MEEQVEMAQEMVQAQVEMHSQKCSKLCRMIHLKILNGVYPAFKIKTQRMETQQKLNMETFHILQILTKSKMTPALSDQDMWQI